MGQLKLKFLLGILLQTFANGQHEKSPSRPSTTSVFLTDIGDFLLNVDEAVAKFLRPQEHLEANTPDNTQNPRTVYFNQIRQNYRNMLKRLGSVSFDNPQDLSLPNLLGLNFQNQADKTSIDVSLPLLPVEIKINTQTDKPAENKLAIDEIIESDGVELLKSDDTVNLESDVVAKPKIKDSSFIMETTIKRKSNEMPFDFVATTNDGVKKSDHIQSRESRRKPRIPLSNWEHREEHRMDNNEIEVTVEDVLTTSENIEGKEITGNSEVSGRMLGSLLFDEEIQDGAVRGFLKNFGQSFLNSEFIPNRVLQKFRVFLKNEQLPEGRNVQQLNGHSEKIPHEESGQNAI